VIICTPDKTSRNAYVHAVVQLNRRTRTLFDEAGIFAKFGVLPRSIPDYLALVGDAADGFPGCPAGAQNRLRRSLPNTGTSKLFRPIRALGT